MLSRHPARGTIIGVVFVAGLFGTAVAQDEAHFRDEEAGFSVWFPSQPKKENGSHEVLLREGKPLTVPALIYSVKDGNNSYTATVADLKGTPADHPDTLNLAAAAVSTGGDVKLDLETSVSNGTCGRDLVVAGHDGGQSIYALFFQHNGNRKLYLFEAQALSPSTAEEGGADALRFQQSVDFVGSGAIKDVPESDDDKLWARYYYYGSRFSMRFPAKPEITLGTYLTAKGIKVNTLVHTVRQKTGLYRVTVADLWHTQADELSAIKQAVSLLGKKNKITSDVLANIPGGQCAHDLQFADRGRESSVATVVFPTASHWLYIIEAQATSSDAAANAANLARFRKSLRLYWNLDGSSPN